jgi:hypothetical protein
VIFSNAGAYGGFRGELEIVPKRGSAHARELKISWRDGATWRVRLDEGFGFLQSRLPVRYDFRTDAAQQGSTLGSARYDVQARNPTSLYAFNVETGAS